MENSLVLFEEVSCANGKKIGIATLNMPNKLNALSLPMIRLLLPQFKTWQRDSLIAVVLLQGAGDRAFCAGGDVVSLHNELDKQASNNITSIIEFFSQEYTLDYLIHSFEKPFVVWGAGVVMGGGLGLMAGASHRISTQTTKMAMPEVNIGLYPDVGATWFLSRMPKNIGLFLGLTATTLNAGDANFLNLSNGYLNNDQKAVFLHALTEVPWGDVIEYNHKQLSDCIATLSKQADVPMPKSSICSRQDEIERIFSQDDLLKIIESLNKQSLNDDWFNHASKIVAKGSPLSVCLIYEQLKRGQTLSLAQCFRLELNLSIKAAQFGEFKEGVRALLIDKDNAPNWHYGDVAAVEQKTIDWFFQPSFSDEQNPLKELEMTS